MLRFSPANTKLEKLEKKIGKKVYSLDLLSGHSCPYAVECRSKVIEFNGERRIKDGTKCIFRCYSASQEVLYPSLYDLRLANYQAIKEAKTPIRIAKIIIEALPEDAEVIRLHVGGDIFSINYFKALIMVAKKIAHVEFYGYTKASHWLAQYKGEMPRNLRLTASYGGKHDEYIESHGLYASKVVYSAYQAKKMGLKLDKNDYSAYKGEETFALLVHGPQPKGSNAGKAWARLKKYAKVGV